MDVQDVLDLYDILVIEIDKKNIENVLKWVFKLHCEKRVPILAILHGCSCGDKIVLNQFGIVDYIDDSYTMQDIQKKLDIMIKKINWTKK